MVRLHDALDARGTTALLIGAGGRRAAAIVAGVLRSPYPVLSDRTRASYAAYGLRRTLAVLQHSGTFLVDRTGLVRYALRAANPLASFDEAALMQALDRLEVR